MSTRPNGTETRARSEKRKPWHLVKASPVVALSLYLRAQSPDREDHDQGELGDFMAQNNKFAVLPKSHKTLNFRGFRREAERRPYASYGAGRSVPEIELASEKMGLLSGFRGSLRLKFFNFVFDFFIGQRSPQFHFSAYDPRLQGKLPIYRCQH